MPPELPGIQSKLRAPDPTLPRQSLRLLGHTTMRGPVLLENDPNPRHGIAFTRDARREILRDADFLWTTPFWETRIRTGSAAARAALAAALSPVAKASSTLRTDNFMRDVRDLLTAVRRTAWRAAFRADVVLAIERNSWVRT